MEKREEDVHGRRRQMGGIVLIVLGILFMLDTLTDFDWGRFWPVILIVIGLLLIWRERGR